MEKDVSGSASSESVEDDAISESDRSELRELVRIGKDKDRQALPRVLRGVKSSCSVIRSAAADTLAEIGDTAIVEAERALISLLSDSDELVLYSAIQALGELDCKSAVPKIIEFLQYEADFLVRVAAAESLGYLDDPVALPYVLKSLTDTNQVVRAFAACSVGLLAISANTPEVRESIRNAERAEKELDVRMELLLASYRLGDPDSKERLRECLFGSPGIDKDTALKILNGLIFFVEYAPPPFLKQDREFFAEIARDIGTKVLAPDDWGQAEIQRILSLLAE